MFFVVEARLITQAYPLFRLRPWEQIVATTDVSPRGLGGVLYSGTAPVARSARPLQPADLE
eukprot:4970557-Lingulodinium_polyedra.AAC.1